MAPKAMVGVMVETKYMDVFLMTMTWLPKGNG